MSLYKTLFQDQADPRVYDWPLMKDPGYVMLFFIGYLLAVKHYGPKWMRNRTAFDLKYVIAFYDLTQIAFCSILVYQILTNGWLSNYKLFGCQNVDYSNRKEAVKMAELVWWTLMLKLYEHIETIFFVLRKKNNQVSFLHVYHHVMTAALTWMAAKYVPGGTATFPVIVNCIVHIIMYVYYFLAIFGPKMQARLAKWKSKVTIIQMTQFCIVLLHVLYLLEDGCRFPKLLFVLYTPFVLTIFCLFYQFYNAAYLNKKHQL